MAAWPEQEPIVVTFVDQSTYGTTSCSDSGYCINP